MRTESVAVTGDDDRAVLTRLGEYAVERGYAEAGYVDALLARESDHPTGLDVPTAGFGIAIPHADPDLVSEAAVVVGLPPAGASVPFRSMDDPETTVDAEAVILLLVTAAEGYATFLSNLASLFQSDEFSALVRERNGEALVDLVVERCVETDD
jgi:PTS system galactitol-specific IIA component